MWKNFDGKAYGRADFAAHVAALAWPTWKPKGIVLHNTGAPTLKQWVEAGPKRDARIRNLRRYYEVEQGWSGGPHLFVSRNWINGFNDLTAPGVHSPSFNRTHFGIEMVGDFGREEFASGDGALVRDNAVFAMAVLCRRLGFDPATAILLHKEDKRTTHDCPGHKVVKADVIARVQAQIAALAGERVAEHPRAQSATKP